MIGAKEAYAAYFACPGFGIDDVYEHASIPEQYMLCFYWVVSTLTTNGQVGGMIPKNLAEVSPCSHILTLSFMPLLKQHSSNMISCCRSARSHFLGHKQAT